MNKSALYPLLITQLTQLLDEAELAASNARLAAVDEQSKAETQYDTLAIEAAYLAEGQSKRIEELKAAIALLENAPLIAYDTIKEGALFSIEFDDGAIEHFLLAPAGAGQQLSQNNQTIKVITSKAPLAQSCIGLEVDDEMSLPLANSARTGVIISVS